MLNVTGLTSRSGKAKSWQLGLTLGFVQLTSGSLKKNLKTKSVDGGNQPGVIWYLVFKFFWDFQRSVVQTLTSDLTANSWLCLISRSDLLRPTLRFMQCSWYLITFHYANQNKIVFSLFSFNTVFIFYINCGSPYMPNYYIWIDCNFCGYKE